jgi:hypothetical protein
VPTATRQLWCHQNTLTTAELVYTCPVGFRTILKSVYVFSPAASGEYRVAITSALTGFTVRLLSATLTINVPTGWSGWAVMMEGDQVFVTSLSPIMNSLGSGSQLLVSTS